MQYNQEQKDKKHLKFIWDETMLAMFSSHEYAKTYNFWAHIVSQCSVILDEKLPAPAGVSFQHNHYNLYIGPSFYEYTLPERLAIIKHEGSHIIFKHVSRKEDRDHKLFNIASDLAINQLIDINHLPKDGLLPDRIQDKVEIKLPLNDSSEVYYDLLKQEQKNQNQSDKDKSEGSSGSGLDDIDTLDDHSKWEESEGEEDFQKDITKKMVEKAMNNAVANGYPGSTPSNIGEILEMLSRKSEVNWKKVLRNLLGNKKFNKTGTIKKSNRRQPGRMELKGNKKDVIMNALVIADVSGSVDSRSLLDMVIEVKNIADLSGSNIDLIQVDVEARKPEKISKKQTRFERKGSGGTYISSALDMASAHNLDYDVLIVCTDGYLMTDDINVFKTKNKKPIVWLIESGGNMMSEMEYRGSRAFKLGKKNETN